MIHQRRILNTAIPGTVTAAALIGKRDQFAPRVIGSAACIRIHGSPGRRLSPAVDLMLTTVIPLHAGLPMPRGGVANGRTRPHRRAVRQRIHRQFRNAAIAARYGVVFSTETLPATVVITADPAQARNSAAAMAAASSMPGSRIQGMIGQANGFSKKMPDFSLAFSYCWR